MDVIALLTWITVAAIAPPLAHHALGTNAALDVQALGAVGGLALVILFFALGGPPWAAFGAAALALIGAVADAFAAVWLISDERPVSRIGQGAEETKALLVGIQLPLLGLAALLSLLAALDVATLA
jgi:hypothetical protein